MATFIVIVVYVILLLIVYGDDVCREGYTPFAPQRPDTRKPESYELERTPSYCDRIVIGFPEAIQDESFRFYDYNAMTNKWIDYSDHDLVYGLFEYDNLDILSVSFNLGKFVDWAENDKDKRLYWNQKAWDQIICDLRARLERAQARAGPDSDYPEWDEIDIIFFGFQETDYPFKTRYLSNALRRSFDDEDYDDDPKAFALEWGTVIEMDGPKIPRMVHRNTYSCIFYKRATVFHSQRREIVVKFPLKQISGPNKAKWWQIHRHIGHGIKKLKNWAKEKLKTKTAVIVGRFRSKIDDEGNEKISKKFITFGNTHLPVDTKNKKDWGVESRIYGMNEIKRRFINRYIGKSREEKVDLMATNSPIVLVGDVNFRVIYGKRESEQLEDYLKSKDDKDIKISQKNNGFWRELMPVAITKPGEIKLSEKRFLPTCKRLTGSWRKQKAKGLLRKLKRQKRKKNLMKY